MNQRNDGADTIDLKSLFSSLVEKLPFLLLALVIGALGTFAVSNWMIDPEYESNISLYVKNNSDTGAEQKYNIDQNDLNVSQSLVSTYIVILSNDTVMDEVGATLLERHTASELQPYFAFDADGAIRDSSLKSCFSMTAVDETEVLQITATTKNAELSQELCNIMAEIAPDYLTRVVGAGSVEKIGDAKLYPDKVSPNVKKNTAIGGLAGLVLAACIVIALEIFNNTLRDVEEIQKRYEKPILGEVLQIGGKKKKRRPETDADRKERLIWKRENIPFSVVENYKTMRTNLVFALSTAERKILAVSSANPAEGKSTTTANLAVTLAETNKTVLLVDGDMRKPVQHKLFALKNQKGLSAILSGEKSFSECVQKGVQKNLDVLTSGVIPPNPSELLASPNMRTLLERASETYDYVLVDTPPLLQVSDAVVLSNWIAGIAVVVKYRSTTYSEIDTVMQKLRLGDCNLTGFILNEIYGKTGGYYSHYGKYGYKYGYKYGQYYSDENANAGALENASEKALPSQEDSALDSKAAEGENT